MMDSHAHILKQYYGNIEDVIKVCELHGIYAIMNCADSIETSREVVESSKKYFNFLYAVIGIHPENADEFNDDMLKELEELIKNNDVKGIGEIGLDYHYPKFDKEKQKYVFEKQIELAEKYNLPIVVHSRDAIQDTYDILSKHKVKGVIHCFSGSADMASSFLRLGFYIGISGTVTFEKSNLYKVVDRVDMDHILVETDSPFLAPEPVRGTRNIPTNVMYVADKISSIKNIKFEDVISISFTNAVKLFDLYKVL